MNKQQILLTGTYSSFNKGDAAMQVSTAQSVAAALPASEVTISTPFPQYDADFYKEFKVIQSTRRNLVVGTLQLIRAWFYGRLGLKLDLLINNEELNSLAKANIVIDLSGDTITEDYGPHVTYSHLLPVLMAIALKRPVMVCAQSIGPFKLAKGLVRFALNRVDRVTARENITYEYLKRIGIKGSKLMETSDMAFLLQPCSKKRVAEILKREHIPMSRQKTLGVSLSDLVARRFNAGLHADDFTHAMAKVLDRAVSELGVRVVFVGHVTGPTKDKDDRLVASRIRGAMKFKKHAYALKGNYRPEELKGVIATCHTFMGARMHANIGALSSGVPLIALRYSHKTDGIMALAGLGGNVYDVDSLEPEALYSGLSSLIAKHDRIAKQMVKSVEVIKDKSWINVGIIKDIIRGASK